jgi:uncharacterized membrane protein
MQTTPIKTKADYRSALKEIETLMSARSDTPKGQRLDVLATLVEAYEKKHCRQTLSSVLVLTAFLTGWPSIIAVILNYAKRPEVRGTWLDSHFGWQIRTFWYALMWLLWGGVAFVTLFGIPAALVLWVLTGLWVLYRIARGWMTLSAQKPMPERAA